MAVKVTRNTTAIRTEDPRQVTQSPHWLVLAALAGVLLAAGPVSADSDTTLRLELAEIYSDNITLTDEQFARTDFVTRIAPSIDIDYRAKAAEMRLGYEYAALLYARESSFNEAFSQLDAAGGLDLIGDTLRLLADGAITQVNVDPQRPSDNSNIGITGNRTNAYTWRVGPQWQQKFSNSRIDAYYNAGKVYYDDPASQDILTQRVGTRIFTDPDSVSDTRYELNYHGWAVDYEVSGEIKEQELYLMLRQAIGGEGYEVYALGGLDSNIADRTDSSLSEGRWEAGVEYRDADGHLSVGIGSRYFGTILRLSAGRGFAKWYYSLDYSEEPGTAETIGIREITKVDDETEPPPDANIDEIGSGKRFIRKRLTGTAKWDGYASNWLLKAWWDNRDDVPIEAISAPGEIDVISDSSESLGLEATYTWFPGQKTIVTFSGRWWEREFRDQLVNPGAGPANTVNKIQSVTVSAAVDYSVGSRTSVGGSLRYYDVSSSTDSRNNFDEIRAMISLSRQF